MVNDYTSLLSITAQASYDRWPEASAMRGRLWDIAQKLGISLDQFKADLDNAPIDCNGGQW